jgi:hypothetical protein
VIYICQLSVLVVRRYFDHFLAISGFCRIYIVTPDQRRPSDRPSINCNFITGTCTVNHLLFGPGGGNSVYEISLLQNCYRGCRCGFPASPICRGRQKNKNKNHCYSSLDNYPLKNNLKTKSSGGHQAKRRKEEKTKNLSPRNRKADAVACRPLPVPVP